jgi:hypothetical protein
MCKRAVIGGFALLLLFVSFTATSAQTPYISAFFHPNQEQKDCPGMGVIDFLHVFLFNANKFVAGVDFAIEYPPSLLWVTDLPQGNPAPVVIGTTPTGYSSAWPIPRNGFFPIRIVIVVVEWNCIACERPDDPIVVIPNPNTLDLAFVDFPNNDIFPALGLKALACATIATEETTWGKVKALYEE